MIFLEFSKRFFTFYFWELECFFVLKRCFSLRPFQWYIVRLATRTGSVSNSNRRITIFAFKRAPIAPRASRPARTRITLSFESCAYLLGLVEPQSVLDRFLCHLTWPYHLRM